MIGLLQLIKEISTSKGVPYIFVPLIFIIAVTMLKDLVEDYKRHRSDWEENTKKVKILQNGQFIVGRWKDIRVGNIIKIDENEYFPADILLLHSSGKKGICFIETKNLDGETNLKQKQVHKDITTDFDNISKIGNARNKFTYEKPNDFLYKFVGSFHTSSGQVALGEPNFVLRGCSLQNTESVIGLVAYTGHHTKMMLNSIKSKPKFSKLEKSMNRQIILVFAIQICFCIFSGLYAAIFYYKEQDYLGYLEIDQGGVKDQSFFYNLFIRFGNWLLLFTNFVPISLLVTLEMVKLFQGIFMTMDPKMTSSSQIKTSVQSSNLNEELGQVDYIFSDKTGTLTQNLMEFKNLSVRIKSYGDVRNLKSKKGMPEVTNVDFLDQDFLNELNDPKSSNHQNIIECLTLMAVCHTIITEEKNGEVLYNASSPDELALVNFAKFVGAEFAGIDENNNMEVNLKGQKLRFQLLHVLEFNSTRKRMSVIVKSQDGKIILYTKGADTVLFERMSNSDPANEITKEHLQSYANVGLRTLLLAKKVIDQSTYQTWAKKYHEASIKIEGRDEAMDILQEEIETDLSLVGATAIEDKLQDEVGLTISKIMEAGIRVWVLTGDKVETAINIGYSCKLLNDTLVRLEVTEKTFEDVKRSLQEKVQIIQNSPGSNNFALIISGDALIQAMRPELSPLVMKIGEVCRSVLACRVSPKQKQEVVSLVRKEKPQANTLAIGDGANDVYMITAANVGVGIRGVEGQQAARASDFAIGEFKILRRLLYVHGREAYRRNSYLILYNFYKNICLVLPQFWFGFVSCFSGQIIYEQKVFQFFNIIFASLPIVIYAVFDEEHEAEKLLNSPKLYIQGIKNKLFNTKKFVKWFFLGIWESFIISAFSFAALDYTSSSDSGKMLGFYGPGMMVFSMAVFVVNFKILSISNQFNVLNLFCVFGSMLIYPAVFWIVGVVFSTSDIANFFSPLFSCVNLYIGSVICIIITYALHLAYKDHDKLVEIYHETKVKPVDAEIQKLLDASPPVHIDHSILKMRDSEEFSNAGSDPRLNMNPGYTGFAFSSPEKNIQQINNDQQSINDKNSSPQRNMQTFNRHNLNRQPHNDQSNHLYTGILNTPESMRTQQIGNDQSYGSPDSSFHGPQHRLNNVRAKGGR